MAILSTERIGVTSAAVPTTNTSSATYSDSRGSTVSWTVKPRSRASVITESRVIPPRIDEAIGGV